MRFRAVKRSTKSALTVCLVSFPRVPGTFTVLSSGMEPETVLWGPDLQGPEESLNDAHRGEGHKKGIDSGPGSGRGLDSGGKAGEGRKSRSCS